MALARIILHLGSAILPLLNNAAIEFANRLIPSALNSVEVSKQMKLKMSPRILMACILSAAVCIAVSASYVLSIVWRVSMAEHEVLGHSMLIKSVFGPEREYDEPPIPKSIGSRTYTIDINGTKMRIWADKVNGFQHAYGSALAAYELGDYLADKLFCANEFAEWFFDKNGISTTDIHDRRRDLANNRIGRQIGILAQSKGLRGSDAEQFMQLQLLYALEVDQTIYTHPYDPRSLALPDEAALGCAHLPTRNGYDVARKWGRTMHRTKTRFVSRVQTFLRTIESTGSIHSS